MTEFSSKGLLHNVGGYDSSDEQYTPNYGVVPILKYIPSNAIVWCPFDLPHSEYVKQISELDNVEVVHSHLLDGKDFFKYEPDKWDYVVSNPPFKIKRLFFERALDLGKPFALLSPLIWLNDSGPKLVYLNAKKDMQLLMFDKRMRFADTKGEILNKITFSSAYYCCDFLQQDIILEKLIIK